MDPFELTQRLAVALAIGLIVGIERGWIQRSEAEGERAAGLRTYALSGLLGGVWGAIAYGMAASGPVALGLAFAAFTAVIAALRYREMVHEKTFGATTVVAAMLVFALGALAVLSEPKVAAAAGVATALLLALKSALHGWVKRLTWPELRSGLILLAMTVIMLPLLPDRELSPWLPVNPREVWLIAIFIAALSFAGYVAIRLAGANLGIPLSGLLGGLVSSTAVTLSMARMAREHPTHRNLFAAAITLAGGVMMLRVLVIVAALNVALVPILAGPLVVGALVQAGFGGAMAYWSRPTDTAQPLALKNPFDLAAVLKFAALLTVIMVLAKVVATGAGAAGSYLLAAVSGTVDVDAISLSMARLAPSPLTLESAAIAILIAVTSNSITKAILGTVAGGIELGKILGLSIVLALLAGAGALVVAINLAG